MIASSKEITISYLKGCIIRRSNHIVYINGRTVYKYSLYRPIIRLLHRTKNTRIA